MTTQPEIEEAKEKVARRERMVEYANANVEWAKGELRTAETALSEAIEELRKLQRD